MLSVFGLPLPALWLSPDQPKGGASQGGAQEQTEEAESEETPDSEVAEGEEEEDYSSLDGKGLVKILRERDKHIKKLNRENAKRRTALKKFEDEETARKAKEATTLEAAQGRIAELESSNADKDATITDLRLRYEMQGLAAKMNFRDAKVAWKLADLTDVHIDDDGNLVGGEEALKALAKEHPYLLLGASGKPNLESGEGKKGATGELDVDEEAIRRDFGLRKPQR